MAKKKSHNVSLQDIYNLINLAGACSTLHGTFSGVATLKDATPQDISFYHNVAYKKDLQETKAGVVILASKDAKFCNTLTIIHDNPHYAFAQIVNFFYDARKKNGIHPSVVIGDNCNIASDVYIGPHTVIGDNVTIGAGTYIHNNVTICDDTQIGANCIFHSGCRIGTEGFGFANSDNGWYKIAQLGKVIIGNNVDIGANATIDCGALEDTIIEDNVKIDNQVQIGHNCRIGKNTVVAGCTGIAGSTIIGKNCMIGGGCNINGHIQINDGVMLVGASTVRKSLSIPGVYSSFLELSTFKENLRLIANLKKIYE